MARKPKTDRVWFENFDLEAEITALITRIETFTKFELPDKKRDMVFSYAATKLGKTKEAYANAKSEGKPVSTSRRDFLETIQDTIFLAIPAENVALMPLSEHVLNDPSYYQDAMCRAASLTEDELFMALQRTFIKSAANDCSEPRAEVSKSCCARSQHLERGRPVVTRAAKR